MALSAFNNNIVQDTLLAINKFTPRVNPEKAGDFSVDGKNFSVGELKLFFNSLDHNAANDVRTGSTHVRMFDKGEFQTALEGAGFRYEEPLFEELAPKGSISARRATEYVLRLCGLSAEELKKGTARVIWSSALLLNAFDRKYQKDIDKASSALTKSSSPSLYPSKTTPLAPTEYLSRPAAHSDIDKASAFEQLPAYLRMPAPVVSASPYSLCSPSALVCAAQGNQKLIAPENDTTVLVTSRPGPLTEADRRALYDLMDRQLEGLRRKELAKKKLQTGTTLPGK